MKTQSLLPLIVLFHVINSSTLSSASEADIRRACAATDFPSDCVEFLKSEPGSLQADLHGLTKIIFQQSQRKATDTYAMIRLLLNNPNLEDGLRAPLGYALEHYPPGIIQSLQRALQAIDANQYNLASSLGSACATTAHNCEEQFQTNNFTSPIKQQDELQIKLCITGVGLVGQLH